MNELTKVAFEETHDGRRLRIVLRGGKGNIVDSTMSVELLGVLRSHTRGRSLKCVALEAEGGHFCFGASVPEHAPDKVSALLSALDGVILALIHSPVPVVAAVRGACLGGGLELVLPCHRIVATPAAKLGLPEVTLGMFAPAGTALLTERVPRGVAMEMLTTGRVLSGTEAHAAGLVDELSDDPEAASAAWFEKTLLPLSASAIRFATQAARVSYAARVDTAMARLERVFVDETMATHDANEGVRSFAEKRKPVWVDA
jgi:cyclohexa-1,5-dienecarbonyl-CoA hydratase